MINFHHRATPNFFKYFKLSIYLSINPSSSIFFCQSINRPLPLISIYNRCRPWSRYRSCNCCCCFLPTGFPPLLYFVRNYFCKITNAAFFTGNSFVSLKISPQDLLRVFEPTGMPLGLRSEIKRENKGDWYRHWYNSLHRTNNDNNSTFLLHHVAAVRVSVELTNGLPSK